MHQPGMGSPVDRLAYARLWWAMLVMTAVLGIPSASADENPDIVKPKSVSAERLLKLVQGKTPEIAAARVHAIGAMKNPEATTALIGLTLDSRGPVVVAALEELFTRVKGEHPYVLPQHHESLIEIAYQLIRASSFRNTELPREAAIEKSLAIYRAVGDATHYERFKTVVNRSLSTESDNEQVAKSVADLAWFLFCDRSDQPPNDLEKWMETTGTPDSLTFLRLLREHDEFRPDTWEDQFEELMFSEVISLRLQAIDSLPSPLVRRTAGMLNFNITGNFGVYPPVQIAALKVATESRSMFFLPAIRKVLKSTEDAEVTKAARAALVACTPKPLVKPSPRDEFPSIDYREDEIDALMLRVQKLDRVPDAIEQLRELTGFDFGDSTSVSSRRAWMTWHSREKSNIRQSGPDGRPFLVYGRITDPDGNPIPQAMAQAYTETRLNRVGGVRVAYTIADNNGRYLLRFGFGKRARDFAVASGSFNAVDSGRFQLRPADKPPGKIISAVELVDDRLLEIKKSDGLLAWGPVEHNFTLYPLTILKVNVVDAEGKPTWPKEVSIAYQEANRDEPTVTKLRKITSRYYYLSMFAPNQVRFQVSTSGDKLDVSAEHELSLSGEYQVRLTHDPTASEGKRLDASVVQKPKKAASSAK